MQGVNFFNRKTVSAKYVLINHKNVDLLIIVNSYWRIVWCLFFVVFRNFDYVEHCDVSTFDDVTTMQQPKCHLLMAVFLLF